MEERRKRHRLPWIEMQAQVRLRKGLMRSQWVDVEVVDYSRQGMGIRDLEGLEVDDRVQLSLTLKTETGDITAENVRAQVRHRRTTDQGVVLGVEFVEDSRPAARDSLARIEGIVERHQKLARRIG